MAYKHVSNCPKCGAPIYQHGDMQVTNYSTAGSFPFPNVCLTPPVAFFTCECRETMPAALPDVGEGPEESTAAVDRKIVEGLRTAAPGDERVSDA